MPWWFMLMPSETEIVVKLRGVPPAARMLSWVKPACSARLPLHGVVSPAVVTTPMNGRAIAASSRPMPRMKARCGARSMPSVVIRDRSFRFSFCVIDELCLLKGSPIHHGVAHAHDGLVEHESNHRNHHQRHEHLYGFKRSCRADHGVAEAVFRRHHLGEKHN